MQAARGASLTSDDQPTRPSSRFGLVLGIGAVFLAVDVGTKILAVRELADRDPVEVLGPVLKLTLVRNPGAAFGSGAGLTPFITAFAILALVVALVVARRAVTAAWAWAMGLLLAGIGGNLIDRMFREPGPLRGKVIDFLQLPNWPVFNVADICINVAAGLIILQSFRGVPMAGRPAPEKDRGPSEEVPR